LAVSMANTPPTTKIRSSSALIIKIRRSLKLKL